MKVKRIMKTIGICGIVAACGLCAGCSTSSYMEEPAGNTAGGQAVYSAQYPYSAEQYISFLAKEIEPVTNELTTQTMLAKKVLDEAYPVTDAVASVDGSLQILEDCITDVTTMQPAHGYEERRMATLQLLQNIKGTLEAYRDLLEENPLDREAIKKSQDVMQADYVALTAEFNVPFK